MSRAFVQPLVFASGISLLLYGHNTNLSEWSYVAPLPFWVLIGRPLGLIWNRSVLKQINRDIFPPEMKNYRELYLVSRRALAYDILFNHTLYNPLLASIIIGYTYSFQKIEKHYKGQSHKVLPISEVIGEIGWSLVKVRALVSLTSIMSEYWISYMSLHKNKEGMLQMNNSNKRLLLVKQLFLNLAWNAYLLKKVNQNCLA